MPSYKRTSGGVVRVSPDFETLSRTAAELPVRLVDEAIRDRLVDKNAASLLQT